MKRSSTSPPPPARTDPRGDRRGAGCDCALRPRTAKSATPTSATRVTYTRHSGVGDAWARFLALDQRLDQGFDLLAIQRIVQAQWARKRASRYAYLLGVTIALSMTGTATCQGRQERAYGSLRAGRRGVRAIADGEATPGEQLPDGTSRCHPRRRYQHRAPFPAGVRDEVAPVPAWARHLGGRDAGGAAQWSGEREARRVRPPPATAWTGSSGSSRTSA